MPDEMSKTPFKKIAMALSGGGFRAASFSLGAMSYLHYLKYPEGTGDARMLDNVQFISSASGGTFAGILYSMHVRQGYGFEETYKRLYNFMNGQRLLEGVLERINDASKWEGDKSRNLINSFAAIYDEQLFGKGVFEVYWPKDGEEVKRPIEVCFNTTEFYRGLSFRFQASTTLPNTGIAGNKYVKFTNAETLKKIKLGDILAASSCFPAGFEPILFPKDFAYPSLNKEELRTALTLTDNNGQHDNIHADDNIRLMDGGIDDNQGVYSAMLADDRKKEDSHFDLFFITDVASYFMDPYEEPVVSEKGKWRKGNIDSLLKPFQRSFFNIRRIVNWSLVIAIIILIVSVLGLGYTHDLSLAGIVFSVTLLLPLLFAKNLLSKPFVKSIADTLKLSEEKLIGQIKKQVPGTKSFSDNTLSLLLTYLRGTPIGVLEVMLKERLNSVLSIVMDVNLKQTRRLIFNIFYGEFFDNHKWKNRSVFNVIYEISTYNIFNRKKNVHDKFGADMPLLTDNCEKLNAVAESARTMGTTLWFDEENLKNKRVDDVIACGQFTTCAKLLEHALLIEKTAILDEEQKTILVKVKQQLLDDWERFKTDPYFQVKEYSQYL